MKDPRLGQCSPSTRGLWIDMLCLMHENERSGVLEGTLESLARVCRCSPTELDDALGELSTFGAATVTFGHSKITVENRRMKNDAKRRSDAAFRASKYRASRGSNGEITPSSSSSTSVDHTNTLLDVKGDAPDSEENRDGEKERIATYRGNYGSNAAARTRAAEDRERRRRRKLSVAERAREDGARFLDDKASSE